VRSVVLRLVVAAALAVAALFAVSDSLSGPARWSPDGLFYQARVYEIREDLSQPEALVKAFQGPLGARLRAIDPDRSGNQQWVAYNARFYERRVAVPFVAAALEPIAGDRAILDVSLAGYVASVLAVFWLLLVLRFHVAIAAAVAGATILLPALRFHGSFPLTDSWGLALEVLAFGTAILALRRGPRWLIPWAALVALLSLTRDSMWIPVLAALWLAVTQRTRITAALAATGIAAALPAMVAVRVPMRELLAQMLNGLQPAPEMSWGTIAGRYPGAIADLLQADGGFVRDGAWVSAAYLLLGLVMLFALTRGERGGRAATLLKAGAVAGAAYILVVPVFSAFRLELVLIPMAAFGLALAVERAAQVVSLTSGAKAPSRKSGPRPTGRVGDLVSRTSMHSSSPPPPTRGPR
jgi:hypothetical protein